MKRAWKWLGGIALTIGAAYLAREVYIDVTTPMPEWEHAAASSVLRAAQEEGKKHNLEVGFVVYKDQTGQVKPFDGAA